MRMPEAAGRWVAVTVVVPFLVALAIVLRRAPHRCDAVALLLLVFAAVFFVYEVLWLLGVLWH